MEMIQPCPVIKQFVQDGDLDTEGVDNVADLVKRATKQMDRASSYVINNILFETIDGKFYAGVITGEFRQQPLEYVERSLDEVLGNRIEKLNMKDATVEDRIHVKMTILAECGSKQECSRISRTKSMSSLRLIRSTKFPTPRRWMPHSKPSQVVHDARGVAVMIHQREMSWDCNSEEAALSLSQKLQQVQNITVEIIEIED